MSDTTLLLLFYQQHPEMEQMNVYYKQGYGSYQ